MRVEPLSSALGAEISGIDLSQPLDDQSFERIEQAWWDHLIVLFRGQKLGDEQQAAFCARFGSLVASYNAKREVREHQHPAVMYVSNIRENGKLIGSLPDGEMHFHSDQCHTEQPAMATMLYAMEIPSKGGDTLFANMYKAYDTLPSELKQKLDGMKAENVYDYQADTLMQRGSKIREGVKHHAHPVFRTHPVTRRKALYVNRLMTDHIVGLPAHESDAVLNRLFDHLESPQFVYAHRWRVGDLILWDNRCTQHARTDFDASERRKLRRITVRGEKPF
jgi:taurine dioxygenase